MRTLAREMSALQFNDTLLPNQASGDENTTPDQVLLFPNILQTHVPAFRKVALAHYDQAAHNDGRFEDSPVLQNWSHVASLRNFVHKSVVKVHTHTHIRNTYMIARNHIA
jgi:hypothetical protein